MKKTIQVFQQFEIKNTNSIKGGNDMNKGDLINKVQEGAGLT